MSGNKLKNSYGTIYHYYKCNDRVRTRTCKSVSVRAEKIEKQVLDCFDDVIFTKHNKDEVLESMMLFLNKSGTKIDKTAGLKKELQEINKQLGNILNAILNGISSPTVQEKLNELENKKKTLTESISKNESKKINLQPLEKQIRDFLNSHDSIYNFTPREQSTILKAFIDSIYFKDGSFTIKLKMLNRVDNVGAKGGLES
ncbi:zinc ribbon domain-containing protein [Peptoniphilus sp. SGI.035]|uniref:zinc ribbon domain-containing protein n=1 Tax=Peptoniphilus sp. SGI.035 TaxID=3420564 RepID=UPI003D029EA5